MPVNDARILLNLPSGLKQMITQQAQAEGVSTSEWIRRQCGYTLSHNGYPTAPTYIPSGDGVTVIAITHEILRKAATLVAEQPQESQPEGHT